MTESEQKAVSHGSQGKELTCYICAPHPVVNADFIDCFVIRRALSIIPSLDEDNQRENLFHTRCLVQGKVCNMIIDSGSCSNLVSTEVVSKLQLTSIQHPRPYKLG